MITNWGDAIITSFTNALNLVFTFIPKLIGFLLILLIGWLVATAVSKAVTFLLRKVGFDRLATRIGLQRFEQNMGIHMDAAGLLGTVVYWFLFLIFLVPALDALGLTAVSNILNQIIAYIPNVFVAILVLFLGTLAATFVSDIVRGAMANTSLGNPNLYANIARWSIMIFAGLIALEQLQIAPALINELFGALVFGTALAFGLAFGLGGQDTARRWLARGESTVSTAASQISSQQSTNQPQMTADQMRVYQQQQAYQQQMAQQAHPAPAAQQPYMPPPQQPYPTEQPYTEAPTEQTPYNRPNPR